MGKHKNEKKSKKHKSKGKSRDRSSHEKKYRSEKHDSSSDEERITKRRRNHLSGSESGSSSEGVRIANDSFDGRTNNVSSDYKSNETQDEWMDFSNAFKTVSNSDRKRDRHQKKQLESDKQQYDPRTCDRELNPYWKSGGDGLPTFKKPIDSDDENPDKRQAYSINDRYGYKKTSWRKSSDGEKSNNLKTESQNSNNHKGDLVNVSKNSGGHDKNEEQSTQNPEYTEKDLNILASKLVRAEIMGDKELVIRLKEKLEEARKWLIQPKNEDVLLTRTDLAGRTQPIKLQSEYGETSDHRRKKKVETHNKDGQRVRYFADDDKYSLKQMFENEKYNTVEDSNKEFSKMANKIRKNDDMDEIFSDNIRKKESDSKIDSRNRDRAIHDYQKQTRSLDNCNKCIQSEALKKHLMVSMGEAAYLALPAHEPLTVGHCIIIPIRHVPCATQLDENEWEEILNIKKSLIKLFETKNEHALFFESAKYLYNFPHMSIECIPLPQEEGDMAPIYFKKAIDESEIEWAQNKKLVSLRGKDVRRAIPKGLPYFAVSFGINDGYAHVIEDEQLFPSNFAQEIIAGMLDLHHSKWKRPKNQSFEEQSRRVLEFSKDWKTYDCTSG